MVEGQPWRRRPDEPEPRDQRERLILRMEWSPGARRVFYALENRDGELGGVDFWEDELGYRVCRIGNLEVREARPPGPARDPGAAVMAPGTGVHDVE